MRALIIYKSVHHGNTKKIALVMAKVLEAEVIRVDDVDVKALEQHALIGFGSGIFHERHHQQLINLIDKIPSLVNKKVFVFSTSGMGSVLYNKPLKKMIEAKGGEVVADFACRGYDTYGPWKLIGGLAKGRPDEGDFEAARGFAKGVGALV